MIYSLKYKMQQEREIKQLLLRFLNLGWNFFLSKIEVLGGKSSGKFWTLDIKEKLINFPSLQEKIQVFIFLRRLINFE